MKYSSARNPSRKLDLIGRGMIRPAGSAINPLIPASCAIGVNPPFVAPDNAITLRFPTGSSPSLTSCSNSLRAACHIWIVRSFCSCSVSKPRWYCFSKPATSSSLRLMIVVFAFGTVISATAMVVPDLVA